jgi:OmpA-OmpF porin, OOP family
LAAALAVVPRAHAQEGAYAGGALGRAHFTEWCDTGGSPIQIASCEDTTTAWKVFGGYRFNPYVGAELSYFNWGKVDARVGSANVSAKQTSYGIAAVGSVPVGRGFALQAKLGLLRTAQETTSPSGRADRSDTETHYGIGARYAFPGALALRAEWERTEKLEVQLLSIGAEYRF